MAKKLSLLSTIVAVILLFASMKLQSSRKCKVVLPSTVSIDTLNYTPPSDTLRLSEYSELANSSTVLRLAEFEGLRYKFYVPSKYSGPTIGCGLDLGTMGTRSIDSIFSKLVPSSTLNTLKSASGLRGIKATNWIKTNKIQLDSNVINRANLRSIKFFWEEAVRQCPQIDSLPNDSKFYVLSYFMHHGSFRKIKSELKSLNLDRISLALRSGSSSYQGSDKAGFVTRRKVESDLFILNSKLKKVP